MKLLIIFIGFLLVKAVVVMLPCVIKQGMFNLIPRKQYRAEEVIKCGHMKLELYYKKKLMELEGLETKKLNHKEIVTKKSNVTQNTNTYKEVDVSYIRERFKRKMQQRELTRSQILAIRKYLEELVLVDDYKEKRFDNDCHCIYTCLKILDKEQVIDLTALANLIQ